MVVVLVEKTLQTVADDLRTIKTEAITQAIKLRNEVSGRAYAKDLISVVNGACHKRFRVFLRVFLFRNFFLFVKPASVLLCSESSPTYDPL